MSPYAAPRPCRNRTCQKLTASPTGYCAECLAASQRDYARTRKDKDIMRLYDTSWHVVRNAFLRSKPLCEQCGAPAEIAHHVVPLKEGGARLDPENLMALCVPCHGKIHGGKG